MPFLARHLVIVELLLGYGRFDQAAVRLTADTLLLFLLGVTAHSAIGVLARAFYARRDTRTPAAAAILAVVINTSLGIALVGWLGLPALGLAIATAAWSEALVLIWRLSRQEPGFDIAGLAWVAVRSGIGAIAAAAVAYLVLHGLEGIGGGVTSVGGQAIEPGRLVLLAQVGLATISGGLVYVGLARAMRIPELPSMLGIVADLVRRRGGS